MALAILDLVDIEDYGIRLRIDTGTNRFHQFKIGRGVRRDQGIDWVDGVYVITPLMEEDADRALLDSSVLQTLPFDQIRPGPAFLQLFSYKDRSGRAAACSSVVRLPGGLVLSRGQAMTAVVPRFRPPRRVPCRTVPQEFAHQASAGDLLEQIVKIAGPSVLKLLTGAVPPPSNGGTGPAQTAPTAGGAEIVADLLKAVLGSLSASAGSSVPATSASQSAHGSSRTHNRFVTERADRYARPLIFGIDDMLIAALVGPIVQVLPQLMNSANQKRVQLTQANNKLVTDVLSDVNRRMLVDRVLDAQRAAAAGAQPPAQADMQRLLELLQEAAPAATAPAASPPAAPPAAPLSLPAAGNGAAAPADPEGIPSSRAVLTFVTGPPVPWNGSNRIVFVKGAGMRLAVRLDVAEPVPRTPLPKAILTLTVSTPGGGPALHTTTVRLRDVVPRTEIVVDLPSGDVAHLPIGRPLAILAQLRWKGGRGNRVYAALGSTELVLTNRYIVQRSEEVVSDERELTDLQRFRPFWNKVWEAPVLDAATPSEGGRKHRWELDVTARYSVLVATTHDSNGIMETRLLRAPVDEESLTRRTEGRLKAGIELSIAELNGLAPLWDASPLDPERLEAFRTPEFARDNAGEFVHTLKLEGRAGQRGIVWVGLVLRLFEFTLAGPSRTEPTGQVVEVETETVRFPLPTAARVLGIRSE